MRTAIVVPSKTAALVNLHAAAHWQFTDRSLWHPEGDLRLFVVDTGITPPNWAEPGGVPDLSKIAVLNARPGQRYSGWCDFGAFEASAWGAERIVFANDDCIVTPNWLDTMLEDLTALKRAGARPGLLGACSNVCASGPQLSVGEGGIHRNGIFYSKGASGIEAARFNGPIAYPRVVTQFAMVETAAYFDAGGFDLDLPSHAWADMILSYRLLRAGYTNAISRAFVCHFGSRTLGTIDHRADFEAGRAYCREKYPGLEKALLIPEEGA